MLTDQPAMGATHLSALVEAISEVDIACTHYPTGPGVPALFAPNALSLLREVDGDRGAREILRHELHLNRYTMKVFENWDTLDIDEQDEWDQFLGSNE
jgi:CTP:molybdopterin cytidylyltransferase MocA